MTHDWVIQIEAVNGPCYVVDDESGDPGRTHNIDKATRYETENLVREVCTTFRMKYPTRKFTPWQL